MGPIPATVPTSNRPVAVYRPRHPERTVLYRTLERDFEAYTWVHVECFEQRSGPLRPAVRQSVFAYLDCGRLHGGFARIRCPDVVVSICWRYGLERAGALAGKHYLGEHDWYREGASMLVEAQRKDGRWSPPSAVGGWGGPGPGAAYDMSVLDTCFALLPAPTVTPGGR